MYNPIKEAISMIFIGVVTVVGISLIGACLPKPIRNRVNGKIAKAMLGIKDTNTNEE